MLHCWYTVDATLLLLFWSAFMELVSHLKPMQPHNYRGFFDIYTSIMSDHYLYIFQVLSLLLSSQYVICHQGVQ